MLHIIACDDETVFLTQIENELSQRLTFPYTLKKAERVEQLEELLEENPTYFDVLLMDIKIYKDNGIDIAASLQKICRQLKVIFITGYIGEYYEAVFLQLHPLGVLSKPVNWNNLELLLENACSEEKCHRFLTVNVRSGFVNIDIDRITYVESIKRVTVIHIGDEALTSYTSLTEIKNALPFNFLRCHKSFIVNMDYIKSFLQREIVLHDGSIVNVSKAKVRDVKNEYFTYIGMGL